MARAKAVWGIDIGQVALKALKLREVDGQVQVEAFQTIEHPTILSQPDIDRPALIHGGGTDLLGCLRDGVFSADAVVSLSAVEELRGIDFTSIDRSVDVIVSRLRRKLGDAGDMIRTVRGVGYVMALPREDEK